MKVIYRPIMPPYPVLEEAAAGAYKVFKKPVLKAQNRFFLKKL